MQSIQDQSLSGAIFFFFFFFFLQIFTKLIYSLINVLSELLNFIVLEAGMFCNVSEIILFSKL